MSNRNFLFLALPVLLMTLLGTACASTQNSDGDSTVAATTDSATTAFDPELKSYPYPFAVKEFKFRSQEQDLQMSYMDSSPTTPVKGTIVLMHGKNFGGYYFAEMIKNLNSRGYRVIVPDQVGFGKSSKPKSYQFSFQSLAENTSRLLENLGIQKFELLGHSMGGMLATRFALMYPDKVSKLFLVNPIGLEDWKTMTSYRGIDQAYKTELNTSPEKIRNYQKESYYDGKWNDEYEKLIQVAIGWSKSTDYPLIAWNSVLTSDMIFTQPVVYEFKDLKVPTILVIGQRDRTAIGKAWAPESMKKKMGNYPQLGRTAQKLIPKSVLVEIAGLGHLPFIEDPAKFWSATNPYWVK